MLLQGIGVISVGLFDVALAPKVVVELLCFRLVDELAVIAREPSSIAVHDAIPPATLELGQDLDDIALAEAKTGLVVCFIVVEGANIDARRRDGASVSIHSAGRASWMASARGGTGERTSRSRACWKGRWRSCDESKVNSDVEEL